MRSARILVAAMAVVPGLAGLAHGQEPQRGDSNRSVDSRVVRSLPSGFSYRQLQRALTALRPVQGATAPTAAGAQDGVPRREIDGLVVDETATKIGRDFYEVFYGAWEAPRGATGFTIRIQEQPAPGRGTRVILLLDDEQLFQLQLQPRYEVVEELAQQAAAYVRNELQRRQPESMPAAAGDPGGG